MKLTKRLVAVALAILMIFGSFSVALTASAAENNGTSLGITTKFLRSVNGVWTVTDKVVAGEDVKLGIYLDTDYLAGDGSILLYYNSKFFEESYTTYVQELTVGNHYGTGTAYDIKGSFYIGSDSQAGVHSNGMNLVADDYADYEDFLSSYEPISISYQYGESAKAQEFDGEKLFCEIPLKVKETPTTTKGLAAVLEATAASTTFQRGKIDIPRSTDGYPGSNCDRMFTWDAKLTFNEEPVSLYTTPVSVSFNANNGKFAMEGTSIKSVEELFAAGEAGEDIDKLVSTNETLIKENKAEIESLPTPTRDGYIFKGWKVKGADDATASEVTVYPAADTEYVAVWEEEESTGNKLNFRTEFYRLDETTGEWVYTEKVKPGEQVKVRLFIDTEYNAGQSQVLLFYDSDFFKDNYTYDSPAVLATNPSTTSDAYLYGLTGNVQKLSSTNGIITDLKDFNYINDEYLQNHTPIAATIKFPVGAKAQVLNGDEWIAEFELTVKENAVGEGDFFVLEDTICDTEDGYFAYTSVSRQSATSEYAMNAENMSLWDAKVDIESNPVSINNTITFKSNGGEFAADDTETYVISGVVGSAVDYSTIPEVSRYGWTFMGWVDASIENPTIDDVLTVDELPATMTYKYQKAKEEGGEEIKLVYNAFWVNEVDITFAIINPETEETEIIETVTVTANDPFVAPEAPELEGYRFVNWTTEWDDETNTLGLLTGLPENYPIAPTTYYAVFSSKEYSVNYYVLNADIENPTIDDFKNVGHVNAEYGSVIPAVPSGYNAPEGYVLSAAYTDVVYANEIVFADANKFVEGTTMPAENYNLYYKIERGEFEAIFNSNDGAWADGETSKTVLAVYDEEIALPEEPVREGYVFAGWDPSVSTMDSEGKVFEATWEPDVFTATYYVDGEEYEAFDVEYTDLMEIPADPYKEGYEFKGWAEAEDSTAVVTLPATMPAADVNYYAVFEALEYTIKFANTGDSVIDDITLAYGTEIPEVANPVKEGYTFTGWDKEIPATMPAEDMTITAGWEINTYTVTWVVDGTETPVSYEFGAPVAKADDPVKKGYTFSGWTGDAYTEGMVMPANDLTYIAVFTANPYDAIFNTVADGETHDGKFADGSTSVAVETLFNEEIVAPEEVPTRTGYTFAGWDPIVGVMDEEGKTYTAVWTPNSDTKYTVQFYSMDTDGTYKLSDTQERTGTSDSVIDLIISAPFNYSINKELSTYDDGVTIAPDGSTVVTVYFERDLFTVTFDGNNGTVDGEATVSNEYRYGALVAVPAVEREGYTFIGWADAAENGNAVDVNLTAVEDATYYAQWEINQYTITFDTVGGTEIDPITQDYATAVTAPEAPTKLGHTFVSWDKEVPVNMPAEDVTLTAQWTVNSYDAIFNAGEGKFADDSATATVEDVVFGEAVTAPAEEPTREGYTFDGWLDADGNPVGTMDDEGKEYFAQWEINQYTITFDTVGGTEIDPITQDYATDVAAPADPEKVGHTFAGWDVDVPGTMPANNMTITAQWTVNSYDATFDAGEGAEFESGASTVTTPVDYDTEITAPEEEPTKTGYTFAGWEDKDGKVIGAGEDAGKMDADGETFTAVWAPNEDTEYKVVVNYTDAATGAKAVEYIYNGTTDNAIAIVDELPDPEAEKTEYVLMSDLEVKGYVLDTEAENEFTGVVAADGSTVLNLYYIATKVTATFDANGGKYYDETTVKTAEIDYNSLVAPVAPADYDAPTQEGYTFGGWQGLNDSTRLQADRTFQAIWNANQYTLTWDTNGTDVEGGEFVQTDDYTALVNKQTYEVREGYTFAGWVDENGAAVEVPDTIPAKNLTIIAKYDVNSYDIKWNDGTKTTTENKAYGSAIVEPAYDPAKEGYTFEGWATADGKTPADVATVPVDGVEFEAQWTKNVYTVNYYVIDPATGEFGAAVATADVAFEDPISTVFTGYTAPTGYTLVAIAYTDTGLTAPLADDAKMPANDVNLYYDLAAKEYEAKFYLDAEKTDLYETVKADYNSVINAPADPTKEGYVFTGWTPAVDTMDEEGKTFVANWEADTFTVTYKANGGVWGEGEAIETSKTFDVTFGTAVPTVDQPTRTGYNFNGWDKTAPEAMPAEDLVFTAQWTIKTAKVVFMDGTTPIKTVTGNYGDAVAAPADPEKTGYTFTGWDATVPATIPEADVTINATWEVNKYDVVWDVDGVTTIVKDVPYGETIKKADDPVKTGYTFKGWNGYTDGMKMPANDVTFTAVFEAETYTVTFDANGGAWDDDATTKTVTGAYGSALEAPVVPSRTGYTFQAWSPSVPTTMPAENATYTAIWATAGKVDYKVETYYMNTEGTYDGVEAVVTGGTATIDAYVKIPVDSAPTGFTYDADEANYIEGVVAGDGSTVFKVYYERNSYKMTFTGNGGTINGNPDKVDTYYYGAQVAVPTAERTGYDFTGWDAAVPATMPAEDVTVNAQWTEAVYTATFKAYPGAFADGETSVTVKYAYGEEIAEAAEPARDGYEFVAWEGYTEGMTMDAEDVTFTATWTEAYYDAVFYTDEALDAVTATTINAQYTKEYNVPIDPAKEGYTFTGWNKVIDGEATNLPGNLGVAGSAKVMPLGGEEYYATWEVNEYKLVYRANGGTYGDAANKEYLVAYGTANADMPVPAEPTREGYSFNGYNAELPETMPAQQVNMVAQWTINTYDATFDAGEGVFESTGETAETTEVTFEDTLYAPEEEPVKEGYTFDGWKDADGNVYYPGDEIGPMGADDVTFKAEWIANEDTAYTVNHIYMDANGTYDAAEVVTENLTGVTDSTVTAAQKDKDNFTFDAAASTVEGVVTADGALVLDLYYVREKNTFTVYDENGNALSTEEVYFDAPISVEEPTKEGYTFDGWKDAEGNEATVPATMPGDKLDIYESWTLNSYDVTFDANTGAFADNDTSKTVETNYGAAIVAPADEPVKAGHTFKGWFDAKENGNSVDTYTSMPALADGETLTFYARWEANTNEYKILIYQMNPDGTMPEEPTSMVINNALVGETVTANVKVPAGFTLDEDASELEGVVPAEGELVLKVVLTRAPHKFTAIVDGNTLVDAKEYYFDQTVEQIATPTKDGYTFAGWSTTANSTTVDTVYPTRMPNNDVTIYGVWTVNGYDAIFNAGEGEFDDGSKTETVKVDFGKDITAPAEEPEREGYEFGGWKDKNGNVYQAGEVVGTMGKDGATLEAVWNKSNFTVTFYGYEALAESPYMSANPSVILGTANYDFGEAIAFPAEESFPAEAQIDGEYYTFAGWAKTADGEVLSNSELYTQTMPAEDVAYYAVYDRVKVMLVPNDDAEYWANSNTKCTTVIDRAGGEVDDYEAGTSTWYVYGLTDRMLVETSFDMKRLDTYIDVSGDGYYEVVEFKAKEGSVGTGTVINVYDNVTGELVESFWIIIYGDLNGDGAITNLDYTIALAEDAGETSWSRVIDTDNYCHYKAKAANVNGDSIFSITDAAQINYYVLGTVRINQATGVSYNK